MQNEEMGVRGKKTFWVTNLLQTTIKLNWAVDQPITSFRPQPLKSQIFIKMWGQCNFLSGIHAVMTSWWQRHHIILSHHSHHCYWGQMVDPKRLHQLWAEGSDWLSIKTRDDPGARCASITIRQHLREKVLGTKSIFIFYFNATNLPRALKLGHWIMEECFILWRKN